MSLRCELDEADRACPKCGDRLEPLAISRVFLLDADKTNTTSSLIKHQIGYAAVIVYDVTPHLHVALDYMHGDYSWYLGEQQKLNFLSTGMTATW